MWWSSKNNLFHNVRQKRDVLPIALIWLGAAIVYIVALFRIGDLSYDEAFSLHFASLPLGQMLELLRFDIHPPLYYVFLNGWTKLFGLTELAGRIPSVIFSLLSLPIFFQLTQKLVNRWVATAATAILTFSFFQIFVATEARMYSLLMLLGIGSLFLFWQVIVEHQPKLWLLTLVNTALVLTNFGGWFGIATQLLWLALLAPAGSVERQTQNRYLLSLLLPMAAFLLWFIPFFLPQLTQRLRHDWFFQAEINRQASVGLFDFFFLLLKNFWLRLFAGTVIFAAPFMVGLWSKRQFTDSPIKLNPSWLLLAWALPAFGLSVISGVNFTRIFSIAYAGFAVMIGYWFFIAFKAVPRIAIGLMTIWFMLLGINLVANLRHPLTDWRAVTAWLTENTDSNDTIILACFVTKLQQQRYAPDIPMFGLHTPGDINQLEEQLTRRGCLSQPPEVGLIALAAELENKTRAVVVYDISPPDRYMESRLQAWLVSQGWQVSFPYDVSSTFGPNAAVYTKNK